MSAPEDEIDWSLTTWEGSRRAELRDWMTRRIIPMAQQARQGLIFFNNHVHAQAPRNAKQLIRLMREQGLEIG